MPAHMSSYSDYSATTSVLNQNTPKMEMSDNRMYISHLRKTTAQSCFIRSPKRAFPSGERYRSVLRNALFRRVRMPLRERDKASSAESTCKDSCLQEP